METFLEGGGESIFLFAGLVGVQFYPWQCGDYDPLKKKKQHTHKDLECWNDQEMNSLMQ